MLLTLGLLLAVLLLAAMLTSALVPSRIALWAGAALNAVQLHTVSILGIYPSLALLSWLALWRCVIGSPLWRWTWMQAVLALAVAQAVSIGWSPSPMLGVRYLIYLLPLLLVSHALYRLSGEQPDAARRCLRLLLLGSALEAALVIVFRLLPSTEIAFLSHPLARVFVSPNTLDALFESGRNNVLDAAKAGGLFVNANIASSFLGMSAIAAWYVGRLQASATLRAVALLDWLAVFFTGSKAGMLCAVLAPVVLALISVASRRRASPYTVFAVIVGLALGSVLAMLPYSQTLLDHYRADSLATLGTREEIWRFAVQTIRQHPLTGLGFGGWELRFQLHGFIPGATSIPAHNSLVILWLQSGLPGLLGGVALVVSIYAAFAKILARGGHESQQLAMATAGAFTWYFIQGLGENFGLIGEIHMTPLLGALLGHLCARHDHSSVRETHEQSVHRLAAAPAVPAL